MKVLLLCLVSTFVLVGSEPQLFGGKVHSRLLTLPHVSSGANVHLGDHSISGNIGLDGLTPRITLKTFQDPAYIQGQVKKLVPIPVEDLIEEEWKEFKVRLTNISLFYILNNIILI